MKFKYFPSLVEAVEWRQVLVLCQICKAADFIRPNSKNPTQQRHLSSDSTPLTGVIMHCFLSSYPFYRQSWLIHQNYSLSTIFHYNLFLQLEEYVEHINSGNSQSKTIILATLQNHSIRLVILFMRCFVSVLSFPYQNCNYTYGFVYKSLII